MKANFGERRKPAAKAEVEALGIVEESERFEIEARSTVMETICQIGIQAQSAPSAA